jgi:hypothetical protein
VQPKRFLSLKELGSLRLVFPPESLRSFDNAASSGAYVTASRASAGVSRESSAPAICSL